MAGMLDSDTETVRVGTSPPNTTYPEKKITLSVSAETLANLQGGLTLTFAGDTTAPLPPDASATVVREALTDLNSIGECEVFREELYNGAQSFVGLAWTVRFYDFGDPQHIGPQPEITVNTSGLS